MKLEAGEHVTPNVKLVRPLGEGGMGAVWVAQHLALDTEVAVKFLQGNYAADEAARARFSQEAAAAAHVKSSHVVKIYDYGITDTNVPFIVMEMLEGNDLSKRLEAEKTISPAALVAIVTQLCKALERAHEKNVVHRDVKPENIFLTQEGGELFVKLLDFGVAKTDTRNKLAPSSRRSTLAGESLGTPYYMSPEQFKSSKSIDSRSDLWSVGVVAYEALTGTLPFVAETVGALAIVVNDAAPVPPSRVNPSLPPAFDTWFAKACARDPSERFQSARELSDALALTFGTMATVPRAIDTGSNRRIVISHVDPIELASDARISLRDTSFATAGGAASAKKTHTRSYAIAGAVAAAVLAVALFAFRNTSTREHAQTDPSATALASSARSPLPAPDAPLASSPASTSLGVDTARDVRSSAPTVATSTPKINHAKPATSASAKGAHGDIW